MAEDFFSTSIREYYGSPGVPQGYAAKTGALPAELAIVAALRDELSGAALLDIGVGPGRTVPFLRPACRRYTGIDYSLNMLRLRRGRLPHAPLPLCAAPG